MWRLLFAVALFGETGFLDRAVTVAGEARLVRVADAY